MHKCSNAHCKLYKCINAQIHKCTQHITYTHLCCSHHLATTPVLPFCVRGLLTTNHLGGGMSATTIWPVVSNCSATGGTNAAETPARSSSTRRGYSGHVATPHLEWPIDTHMKLASALTLALAVAEAVSETTKTASSRRVRTQTPESKATAFGI